ncbi:hypothetical protein E8E13_009645 [Curvularia kusanoi]|uniref:Uncharacterized protein n=1 Tax=Curvularia kusanoi TaxID=90978 RepID=A0A9P4WBL0_CURKU|nr:hypothetical protein E8E13_009645 [Curvularia kusanoi]
MVFITSDLFGPVNPHAHPHLHHRHNMAEAPHDAANLGKRKRTQDGDGANTSRAHRPQHSPALHPNSEQTYTTADYRPIKQIKRISPKLALVKSPSHLMDMDTDAGPAPPVHFNNGPVQPHAVTDLRACHACKTAPKRKSDLENYMDFCYNTPWSMITVNLGQTSNRQYSSISSTVRSRKQIASETGDLAIEKRAERADNTILENETVEKCLSFLQKKHPGRCLQLRGGLRTQARSAEKVKKIKDSSLARKED